MRGVVEGLLTPHPLIGMMPGVYQQDMFAVRLTAAFDDALAPVICTLDNLEAYVDPALVPPDMLRWLADWVGVSVGERWAEDRTRLLIRRAVELYQWRGTVRGLRALVEICTGLPVEVEEPGGVWTSATPGGRPGELSQPDGHRPRATKAGAPKGSRSQGGRGQQASPARPAPSGGGAVATAERPAAELVVRVEQRGRTKVDAREIDELVRSAKPAHVPHRVEVVA